MKGRTSLTDFASNGVLPQAVGCRTSPLRELTPLQVDVVAAIAAGLTDHEIAGRLAISEATIATTLSSAQRTLGASNRLELVLLALYHHLLDDFSAEIAAPSAR